MKHAKSLITLLAMLLLSACSHTVLTSPLVSMTKKHPPKTIKPGKQVAATYCTGEKPMKGVGGTVGMMDEAVFKAQKQSGAKYLADAVFVAESKFFKQCMTVQGNVVK